MASIEETTSFNVLTAAVESNDCEAVAELLCGELNLNESDILEFMEGIAETGDLSAQKSLSKASVREPSVASTYADSSLHNDSLGLASSYDDELATPRSLLCTDWDEVADIEEEPREFTGYFTHLCFGPAPVLAELVQRSSASGSWTVEGETVELSIHQENGFVYMAEMDGPTQLEGRIDAATGSYTGVVIQDGIRGGKFEFHAGSTFHDFASRLISSRSEVTALPEERRTTLQAQLSLRNASTMKVDLNSRSPRKKATGREEVLIIHAAACGEKVVASFSKHRLRTIGEVRAALSAKFGQKATSEVKFIMQRHGKRIAYRDSDRVSSGRLLIVDLCIE